MAVFDLQGFIPPVLHHCSLLTAQPGQKIWPHLSFLSLTPPSRPPLFLAVPLSLAHHGRMLLQTQTRWETHWLSSWIIKNFFLLKSDSKIYIYLPRIFSNYLLNSMIWVKTFWIFSFDVLTAVCYNFDLFLLTELVWLSELCRLLCSVFLRSGLHDGQSKTLTLLYLAIFVAYLAACSCLVYYSPSM